MEQLNQIKRSNVYYKEKLSAAIKILKENGFTKPKHIKAFILKEHPQYDTKIGTHKLDNVLGYKSGDAQIIDIIQQLANQFTEQK